MASGAGPGFAVAGAVAAGLAVAAGAFGAHALKARLSPEMLAVFETAARYQMYHGLALVALGLYNGPRPCRTLQAAGWLFVAGIAVFSGSLYTLALGGARWWGAVTPVGGVLFLAGWTCLAVGLARGGVNPAAASGD